MEQYHAFANKGPGKNAYPWLINIQHPVANVLNHVLVIPAIPYSALSEPPPVKICPVVNIMGNDYVAMTHMMAGLPQKELGDDIADLMDYRDELRSAVDFLIQGY